ncbi:MAG: hypothetical protein EOO12_02220 [Chitinophagaceae bacterium]|nr:MAG: hypothetical protein EOO12_02220 [Chitinophagaceae bacterium]
MLRFGLLLPLFLIVACNAPEKKVQPAARIDRLSWLEGRWAVGSDLNELTPNLVFENRWRRISDSVLAGVQLEQDSVQPKVLQTMHIVATNGRFEYTVVIPGKYKAESYTLYGYPDSAGVFVNPVKEFPYRVRFQQLTADSATEITDDPQGGKIHLVEYLKRLSND